MAGSADVDGAEPGDHQLKRDMSAAEARLVRIAKSYGCIAIGWSITFFVGCMYYRVEYDPFSGCGCTAGFLVLIPSVPMALWALWSLCWHLPDWRSAPALKRALVAGQAMSALVLILLLFYG